MTIQKKKRLSGFDFTKEHHAVALVSDLESGAANGYKTLVMKSTDVVVELSMAEYLSKFFNLWSYDAQIISKLLGYSDDYELWDEEKITEKTMILKSMKDQSDYSKEDMQKVADIVKSMATASNFKITDLQEIVKAADGEEPVSKSKETENISKWDDTGLPQNTSPTEEVIMTDTIEKSVYEAELEKAKQIQAEKDELLEIQKGLTAELEEFRKAKAEAEKAQYTELAKGFKVAGVADEQVEPMAVALQKASQDADMKILVDTFTRYVELNKSLEGEQEQGHGLDPLVKEESGLMTLIKSKKETK